MVQPLRILFQNLESPSVIRNCNLIQSIQIMKTILDQTKTHDSFRYNQIKIYLTPSNTFPSHSRLLPLSVWIDPSPFSIISIDFLLWAETSRLYIHTSKYTNSVFEGDIKRNGAWLRWVDLGFEDLFCMNNNNYDVMMTSWEF